jgi:hypothetical protein
MSTSRRRFLRGAGGILVGLPLFESLLDVGRAEAAGMPKRFVAFFTPGGTVQPSWTPQGTGPSFVLAPGSILEPLDPHRADLLVVSGMQLATALSQSGNPHTKGMAHALTCIEHSLDPALTDQNGEHGWGGGISLDQELAKQVGANTKVASIELGVQTHWPLPGTHPINRISYLGANQPVSPEHDPKKAFDRLFADALTDPAALQVIRAQRRSVLDFVADDFAALAPKLAVSDRHKLEAHLAFIREIEKRLDAPSCAPPPLDGLEIGFEDNANFPDVGRLHMDILAAALACDLTRVGTLQWSSGNGSDTAFYAGMTTYHHQYQHAEVPDSDAALIALYRWYAEQFAYLLDKLSVTEGDGTRLIDNTVVLWLSEISDGPSHSQTDMPYVLAGSCGGELATGRHVALPGRAHSDLMLSLLNAMGIAATAFGNPAFCSGPINELFA